MYSILIPLFSIHFAKFKVEKFSHTFVGSNHDVPVCHPIYETYLYLLRTQVLLHLTKNLWDYGTLSFRDLSFYLSSTLIYQPILIKMHMNAYLMNTQICYLNKYDLKGHKSSSVFSVNPTLPLLDGPLMLLPPNCVDFSLTLHLVLSSPIFFYSLSISLFCSMRTLTYALNFFS